MAAVKKTPPREPQTGTGTVRRYSRVREKLSGAVARLVTGEGDVRQRLRSAHWLLNHLHESELPPELLADWQNIMHRLTRRGPERDKNGEIWQSALEHTMRSIQNRTGSAIARDVYALYRAFVNQFGS